VALEREIQHGVEQRMARADSRNEDVQQKLGAQDCRYDLVVCDEAHKLSATFLGGEVKPSGTWSPRRRAKATSTAASSRSSRRRVRPSEAKAASGWPGGAIRSFSKAMRSLSRRAMATSFSRNQLPVRAASSLSLVRISKGR
jgi:hypothetical protein